MTNKYSGLSDFEVNKLIARRYKAGARLTYFHKERKILFEKGSVSEILDYCKNYNDAMSLMIDNKIALSFSYDIEKWIAKGTFRQAKSTNPCRAIAECYLLIKDAEKKDDKKA